MLVRNNNRKTYNQWYLSISSSNLQRINIKLVQKVCVTASTFTDQQKFCFWSSIILLLVGNFIAFNKIIFDVAASWTHGREFYLKSLSFCMVSWKRNKSVEPTKQSKFILGKRNIFADHVLNMLNKNVLVIEYFLSIAEVVIFRVASLKYEKYFHTATMLMLQDIKSKSIS